MLGKYLVYDLVQCCMHLTDNLVGTGNKGEYESKLTWAVREGLSAEAYLVREDGRLYILDALDEEILGAFRTHVTAGLFIHDAARDRNLLLSGRSFHESWSTLF